jgi:AcrR family transcriptional regulator
VGDTEILYATYRALAKEGFRGLTLESVAKEVHVTPAALVKRFGSKRKMLMAFFDVGIEALRLDFARARAAHGAPLDALESIYVELARYATSPVVVANTNSFYSETLGDPGFRRRAQARAKVSDNEVRAQLDAAIASGDLRPCDTGRLSRVLRSALNGAFVLWAASGEDRAIDWVQDCFLEIIDPHRVARAEVK